jgi:hypothetical protein
MGLETKNDCADEGRQKFTGLTGMDWSNDPKCRRVAGSGFSSEISAPFDKPFT